MDSDRDLAGAKLGGGLLIREARNYELEHFALARGEERMSLPQLGQFRPLLPRCFIQGQGGMDGLQ
jgi:hypothetical protein